jgi:hypothetical protein
MVKAYALDDIDLLDNLEEIAGMPQPVYLYNYDGDEPYLIVSTAEIDPDDLDNVARDAVEIIADESEDDVYDDQT